jgi:hypothetical protein
VVYAALRFAMAIRQSIYFGVRYGPEHVRVYPLPNPVLMDISVRGPLPHRVETHGYDKKREDFARKRARIEERHGLG